MRPWEFALAAGLAGPEAVWAGADSSGFDTDRVPEAAVSARRQTKRDRRDDMYWNSAAAVPIPFYRISEKSPIPSYGTSTALVRACGERA